MVVESNYYFPLKLVKMEYLTKNEVTYTYSWKGVCNYYDVTVDGKTTKMAHGCIQIKNSGQSILVAGSHSGRELRSNRKIMNRYILTRNN